MTVAALSVRATELLGRDVPADFVRAIVHGDRFVYQTAADRDPEACNTVLGLWTGRLA